MTSIHDVTGRQLSLVTAPAKEFGDGLLHTMVPCLPGLMMAPKKGWKNTGMLAGVADCWRSQKWGFIGRFGPGFKPRCGSHVGSNHRVWGLPLSRGLGTAGEQDLADMQSSVLVVWKCWELLCLVSEAVTLHG